MFKYKRPVKPHEYRFTGHLYTLIDGACFSTTGHLLALLKHHNLGIFVGEESGGGFMCTDGSRETTMRHTKVRLYSSTMIFRAATVGQTEGRGVMPDYRVTPSLADYLSGTDAIMNKALEIIAK